MTRLDTAKREIIDISRKMLKDRLVTGTSGNVSCIDRETGLVVITPTSVDYDALDVSQVVVLDLNGAQHGGLRPSSETPMHLSIYRERSDIHAIVHTHSMYATTFAVLGEPIPPIHYMVTALGGREIPVTASYELYGTDKLAQAAVQAMGQACKAVLLRHHGAIAVGATLSEAYKNATIVEEMAQLYFTARSIGTPQSLSQTQVSEVMSALKSYGYGKVNE